MHLVRLLKGGRGVFYFQGALYHSPVPERIEWYGVRCRVYVSGLHEGLL